MRCTSPSTPSYTIVFMWLKVGGSKKLGCRQVFSSHLRTRVVLFSTDVHFMRVYRCQASLRGHSKGSARQRRRRLRCSAVLLSRSSISTRSSSAAALQQWHFTVVPKFAPSPTRRSRLRSCESLKLYALPMRLRSMACSYCRVRITSMPSSPHPSQKSSKLTPGNRQLRYCVSNRAVRVLLSGDMGDRGIER